MLNDLYGIQVRGGCMCAGTYGHDLLGIGQEESEAIRCSLDDGDVAAKPGWLCGPDAPRECACVARCMVGE